MLGGQIGAMSKQGLGSTFWFTVPLQLAEPPRPRWGPVPTCNLICAGGLLIRLWHMQLHPCFPERHAAEREASPPAWHSCCGAQVGQASFPEGEGTLACS